MAAMDTDAFARRFELAYRDLYLRAVRRVRDKRDRLTAETTAFLLHLAEAGPMSLTELARHMGRAQSTTSEMALQVLAKPLLARAAEGLTPAERADLTRLMDRLNTLLKEQTP